MPSGERVCQWILDCNFSEGKEFDFIHGTPDDVLVVGDWTGCGRDHAGAGRLDGDGNYYWFFDVNHSTGKDGPAGFGSRKERWTALLLATGTVMAKTTSGQVDKKKRVSSFGYSTTISTKGRNGSSSTARGFHGTPFTYSWILVTDPIHDWHLTCYHMSSLT